MQNGTLLHDNNVSENSSSVYTGYVQISKFNVTSNLTGWMNISFQGKVSGSYGYYRIFLNGVQLYQSTSISTTSYAWFNYSINQKLNVSDIISVQWYQIASDIGYVKDFGLYYDYSIVSIQTPSNNSAQTSRNVNITWIGTAPFQYQVSQASDFSELVFNVTTSNNFSGNLTLPTGLNYIRVRGYNATEDSMTNWSSPINVKIMSNIYDIDTIGLIGWWHFDDNKIDSSNSHNNLTLVGGTDNYTLGHLNNGSYLNASQSSYYNTSNTSTYNLDINTPFTMVTRVKFTESTHASARQYFFANLGADLGGYEWYYNNGGFMEFCLTSVGYSNGRCIEEKTTVINDSIFHILVLSYNGTGGAASINYYVDGIKRNPDILADALSGTSITNRPMFIGSRPYDNYGYFTGVFDESLFYNRGLSQDEITRLDYDVTQDNPYPSITSWGNDASNDNSLNLDVYVNTTISFNVSVNQSVITGYWNGSNAMNGTASSKTFNSTGNYTVDYYAQTQNGTTNKLQWNITVNPIPVLFISPTITSGREDWNKNSTTIKIQGIKNISSATLYWYPRVWESSVYSMNQENATVFSKNFTFDEDDRFSYWVNVSFVDGTYYELGKGDGYLYVHSKNNISYFKTTFKPFSASKYNRLKMRYKSFVGGAEFIGLAWTNLGVDCEYEGAPCYQNYYIPNDSTWHVLEENITAESWRGNIDLLRFNPWNSNSSFSGDFLVDYVEVVNSSNISDYIVIDNFSYPNYQSYWGGQEIDNNLTWFSNPWVELDRTVQSETSNSAVYLHQRSDGSYYSSQSYNESGMTFIELEWKTAWLTTDSINNSGHQQVLYRCYYAAGNQYYDDTNCNGNSSTQIGAVIDVPNIHTFPLKRYVNASGYYVSLADRTNIPIGYTYEKTLGYVGAGYLHQEDMIYINNSNITVGIDKKYGSWAYFSNGSEGNLINVYGQGRFGQMSTYRIGSYEAATDVGRGGYHYFDMNPAIAGTKYGIPPTNITVTNGSTWIFIDMDWVNYNPDWGNHRDSRMRIRLNYSLNPADSHVLDISAVVNNNANIYYGNNPHQFPGISLRPKFTRPWYYNGSELIYIGTGTYTAGNYYNVPSALFMALFDENNETGLGSWNWGKPPGYFGTDSNDTTLTSWDMMVNGLSNNIMISIDPYKEYSTVSKIYLGNFTDMINYFAGLQYGIIFNESTTPINQSIQTNEITIEVQSTDIAQIHNATLNWHNATGNFSLSMVINALNTTASITMSGISEYNYSYNVSSYSSTGLYAVTSTVWTNYDITPPQNISNLQNTSAPTSINWSWTDPIDSDFSYVMIYLNGIWQTNVSAGTQYYLNSTLQPDTEYTISTHTVDTAGNVNQTWVNQTTRTDTATIASFTKVIFNWWD